MGAIGRDTIIGCVLAGGRSTRMGGNDKAFAELDGRPLIGHVLGRLKPQVRCVAVNSNRDPAAYLSLGVPVFADAISGFAGPLAGIHASMLHARALGGVSHVVTAAADTPFLPLDLVSRLAAAATAPETIVLAASGDRVHPVVGLWPVALADELGLWLVGADSLSVRRWTDRRGAVSVSFPAEGPRDPFFNVNTPGDLATAGRLLRVSSTDSSRSGRS